MDVALPRHERRILESLAAGWNDGTGGAKRTSHALLNVRYFAFSAPKPTVANVPTAVYCGLPTMAAPELQLRSQSSLKTRLLRSTA